MPIVFAEVEATPDCGFRFRTWRDRVQRLGSTLVHSTLVLGMADQRDRFNQYAGYVLAALDKEHANPVLLGPSKIVAALGQEPPKENIFLCQRSLSWLDDNGYFKCAGRAYSGNPDFAESAFHEARLTTLGFSSLNLTIDFRDRTERIGDALADQLGKAAGVARDTAVSEIIGRLIGTVARGLVGT